MRQYPLCQYLAKLYALLVEAVQVPYKALEHDLVLKVCKNCLLYTSPGEKDGEAYFFRTKEEFEQLIREDGLIAYSQYVENYYGTPRKYVEEMCIRDSFTTA